jgi:hypothetical protein
MLVRIHMDRDRDYDARYEAVDKRLAELAEASRGPRRGWPAWRRTSTAPGGGQAIAEIDTQRIPPANRSQLQIRCKKVLRDVSLESARFTQLIRA